MLQWLSLHLLLVRPRQMAALILQGHSALPRKAQFSRAKDSTSTSGPYPQCLVCPPLPATLWDIRYERFVSSLWMMTNGSSPRSYSPLVTQLTFLTLWPLCPTEKRLLITGSYFSCTFGEMGNKKIKGTHWGKITSELNCWHNMDAGIMSHMQITGRRKYK